MGDNVLATRPEFVREVASSAYGVVEKPLMRGSADGALPQIENEAAFEKLSDKDVQLCFAVYIGAHGQAKTIRE